MDAVEIEQMLRDLEARVSALEKNLEGDRASVAGAKKQSPKEFLLAKNPASETQKVLTLAYFLEHQKGLASFNVPDLEAAFRAAREKLPKNTNDAVNKNIARGFLEEAAEKKDSKKTWHLTSTGERFVENGMKSSGLSRME